MMLRKALGKKTQIWVTSISLKIVNEAKSMNGITQGKVSSEKEWGRWGWGESQV